MDLPRNRHGFVLARDVRAAGLGARLASAVADGSLQRVHRGVYLPSADPSTAASASEGRVRQYTMRVLAAAQSLEQPIFTGFSACALMGLPIIGPWPERVFVMSSDRHGHSRPGLTAVAKSRDFTVSTALGYSVTSVEFTLVQLARRASLAAALTATDAALRVGRGADAPPPLTTVSRLRAEHERLLPYPGSRRAEAVLSRTTPLADTPLETASRLVIEELGFPPPELQHRLWLPNLERSAFLDFHWEEYGVGAEADGQGKYLGERGARASAAVVIAEKEREDELRLVLRGFARWDWSEMWGRRVLGERLRRAGLPVVSRPVRLM
ncbi:type IV toxin-antitoxin system AbiEi family antitoxin domain-containing protein [Agromyces sp. NPDC058110]|uniref:type IV toxin-antitoxin system AbiEi family antitoxin domain-containing protein n=1 Tax=Agromyces sp. NPDC058110 TaxID=3346345 RepID=UPI0036DBE39F